MSDSTNHLKDFINHHAPTTEALQQARQDAGEFSLATPDAALGQLIRTLLVSATHGEQEGAVIAATPAIGVVGLYILSSLPDRGTLTCIDPEAEHQRRAKKVFRQAGYAPSRTRFLPSRPLDVLSRMAPDSYHLIYLEVDTLDLRRAIDTALPLLTTGGTLILVDSLLDATISDETRNDRQTVAAREAFEYVNQLQDAKADASGETSKIKAVVAHLPLGAGTTFITREA